MCTQLDQESFNNSSNVRRLLNELAIPDPGPAANDLKPMMRRRHRIVHEADKSAAGGEEPISPVDVGVWSKAVEQVCNHIVANLK